MPVDLAIDGTGIVDDHTQLSRELCRLYRDGLHCDMSLTCGGEKFPVHRLVLAAASRIWRERLQSVEDAEVQIAEVSQPEAVRLMLDCIYETDLTDNAYEPSTPEVNREALILARGFELPRLSELAMRWLAKEVTTENVVEKLRVCREFKLEVLHAKIIEQLMENRLALTEVSRSSKIAMYPELMQALLQQAAANISSEGSAGRGGLVKQGELDDKADCHQGPGKDAEGPGEGRRGHYSGGDASEEFAEDAAESATSGMDAAPGTKRRRSTGKSTDEKPQDNPVEAGAVTKTRKCGSKTLEEPVAEEVGEGSQPQPSRRRRSAGKQGESKFAEETTDDVGEEAVVTVAEVAAPKKRLKKGPGK